MSSHSNSPLVLTVRETAQLLRIHRPKVYDLIHDRTLDAFKLGADWRIRRASVERLIGEIPTDFFGARLRRAAEPEEEAA